MGLADLFRPKWRHSKAAVRTEALRGLGADAREIVEQMARHDADPGVRRLAIEKLDEPDLLASIAREDASATGAIAGERAASLWQAAAIENRDPTLAQRALERLTDPQRIVAVVSRARGSAVRAAALRRVTDPKAQLELVREITDPKLRLEVVHAITDQVTLRGLAVSGQPRDAALAAVERLEAVDALALVAKKARGKSIRSRAKKRLEAIQPPPSTAAPALGRDPDQWHAEQTGLVEAAERIATEQAYDQASAIEAIGQTWARLDQPDPTLSERLGRATERFASELSVHQQAEAVAERERAAHAEQAARQRHSARARDPAKSAPRPDPPRRNRDAPPVPPQPRAVVDPQVEAEQAAQAMAKLESTCEELEQALELATLQTAREHLKRAAASFASPGRLPTRQARECLTERYEIARSKLQARVQELAEAAEWVEWSIRGKQKTLVANAVTLQGSDVGVAELSSQLKALQQEWKALRIPPSAKSRALWEAFRTACDAVYDRVILGHAENLSRREELCAQAESLSDSTDWNTTTAALKELQAVWKATGPVARSEDRKIWERFRGACDAFFERRKLANATFVRELENNAERKQALVSRAEGLLEGIVDDATWTRATDEVKTLQRTWKTIGPVPRKESDAQYKRFKAACDGAFGKLDTMRSERQRGEAEQRATARDQATARLDAPDLPAAALVALWAQVLGLGDDALLARCRTACAQALALDPYAFAGTELEPTSGLARKKKLCERAEGLIASEDTLNLAQRLESALANNALGGAQDDARARTTQLAQLRTAWRRIGPTPGHDGAALETRFADACGAALPQGPAEASPEASLKQ